MRTVSDVMSAPADYRQCFTAAVSTQPCHPERSSCFASRSSYEVEGPRARLRRVNAERHSHDAPNVWGQNSLKHLNSPKQTRGCIRFADAHFAQDDRIWEGI